mgnify:CR=1 FL=1
MSDNLGTEKISRLFMKMAIPSVISQLVVLVYNMVDRIFIGHIPDIGSTALTGVGICMPVTLIVSAFAQLTGIGGAPLASMALGRNDKEEAERILGTCCFGMIVVSVLLTITGLVFSEKILFFFGASSNTIFYAREYLNIYLAGTIFVELTIGLTAFITAQGFTAVTMVSVTAGAILNVFLDPLLIFGFHMGVKGAALATIISQAVSTIWVVHFLCSKKTDIHLRKKYMPLQAKVILPCVTLGLAAFIMQASESIVNVCFNSSLLRYGGDIAVGAMTILTSVMQFAMLPLQGIAQGAQPISSFNYGAKNADRVKKTFRLLLITCLTYSTLLWAAVQLVPQVFVSIFTSDAGLVEFTAPVLRIYLGGLFLFGIQIACQMTFTSLGKAVNSIVVAVVRKFVLLLPLIYIMPQLAADQTQGVYMAEPIADILAVTFTSVLFAFQFKKALAEIQD